MDGNKDEALRCVRIAEEAIGSGDKRRALKFIKIAQRLNGDLPIAELLAACEKLGSESPVESSNGRGAGGIKNEFGPAKNEEGLNGERSYTEEHVQLIRQIRRNKDYYAVLGVEKTCSVEEIRKAYRKLSLKVHPDKNKAPGSEEAFKTVSKAFKCLSDGESRRQYDQIGLVDEFEYNQQHTARRRRRRTGQDIFEDEFDPNEIFRAFFGQGDMFRASHVYRARGMGGQQPREEFHGGGLNFMLILQILPFLIIILLAYLPFSEPEYSLHKNYSYQVPKTTEKYGVEFYVKSAAFDDNYPIGSSARGDIEDSVIKDYKSILLRYCQVELQRRHWNKNLPTPHCNKLHNLGLA
ncbi:chaperone protein dnaJ 49 [Humulus lupulus]|uniref:chaperone protein dnaJ 49 n=1 Tax=Humulus lupulus TaxID=3486 RepID=UPI002B4006C6|nr:chaperone protein dnaJ 49 [Humulus lupulus]XP_062108740.1 chaperone protein dnaJ 49 [Humulus lupulus]